VLVTTIEYQGHVSPNFYSLIDSGADSCSFPPAFGTQASIDVKSGKTDSTAGVVATQLTYFHSVRVHINLMGQSVTFDCYAGFQDGLDQLGIGILGRRDFFDLFESVTLDNKKKMVELRRDIPQPQPIPPRGP